MERKRENWSDITEYMTVTSSLLGEILEELASLRMIIYGLNKTTHGISVCHLVPSYAPILMHNDA